MFHFILMRPQGALRRGCSRADKIADSYRTICLSNGPTGRIEPVLTALRQGELKLAVLVGR